MSHEQIQAVLSDLESDLLAEVLLEIESADASGDYTLRNQGVYEALMLACSLGYPMGLRLDPDEPEWPVASIELPGVGQVSWHLPQYPGEWDGHSTEEKHARIRRFVRAARR